MARRQLIARWLPLVLAAVLVASTVRDLVEFLLTPADQWFVGSDYRLYMDATSRWLAGGPFYLVHQLAGPYVITSGDILYPPWSLPLFVAFTFLPAILWWAIPVIGTAAVVVRHRPTPWAWAGIALCLWFPFTPMSILYGNPSIWVAFFVALGTIWHWPSAFVLIKPTAAPFALVGIHTRGWWLAFGLQIAVAIVLLPLTLEWITAMRNSINPAGLFYNAHQLVLYMIPLIAWLGSASFGRSLSPRLRLDRAQTA